ncbi:MAG: hypothetical protein ABI288_10780 [Ginsengibacter sp.]
MIKYFKLRNTIKSLLFVLTFSGCAALGTKTLTKSKEIKKYNISKIGYSQLASENILNRIKGGTSEIFQLSMEQYFENKSIKIEKHTLMHFDFIENIDPNEIINICKENNLDGFLCTQIKYKFVNTSYMFIPTGKSEDVYVNIKLFNNTGELMCHTRHNTLAGNSYMMAPKANKTIRDGTFGALNQIFKEISRSKKDKSKS